MAGEWREETLDRLGGIVTGKTPPSGRADYFGGDIPFVTPTDFNGRRVIDTTARRLTERGADAVRGSRIPAGAVMVSCIGSDMGKAAIAGHDSVTNQQINSIVVESGNDALFVYYNLSTRKSEIRAAAGGSAQPILNKTAFGQFDILLPTLPEQRAIAHILGTLDDKLELNRRMSETLEAMARALFKSWFVDFDPVVYNAVQARNPIPDRFSERAARYKNDAPGPVPADLLQRFPDAFEDSEMGEIPEGWEVKPIGDVVRVFGGSTPSTKVSEYWNGEHCWTTPKDLSSQVAPVLLDTGRRITKEGLSKISSGLLPVDTLLLSSRAPVGYLAITKVPVAVNQGYIAMPPNGRLSSLFLLYWCGIHMDRIKERAGGTTFQEISKKNFRTIPILVPTMKAVTRFNQTVGPMFERIVSSESEYRILAALRDTLLPKLISGDLRIKDAERFLGKVT